jgi:hypothetical protein
LIFSSFAFVRNGGTEARCVAAFWLTGGLCWMTFSAALLVFGVGFAVQLVCSRFTLNFTEDFLDAELFCEDDGRVSFTGFYKKKTPY